MSTTEYQVVQSGGSDFLVTKRIGELHHVIATAVSRDYAQQIVAALAFADFAEAGGSVRRSWDDLAR